MRENSTNIQAHASIKEKTTQINHVNTYNNIHINSAGKAFVSRVQHSLVARNPNRLFPIFGQSSKIAQLWQLSAEKMVRNSPIFFTLKWNDVIYVFSWVINWDECDASMYKNKLKAGLICGKRIKNELKWKMQLIRQYLQMLGTNKWVQTLSMHFLVIQWVHTASAARQCYT